jgi:hypothetical protein
LRTGAVAKQSLAHLERGTAAVKYGKQGDITWAAVRVRTPRDPSGYVVRVPLVASRGVDDEQNARLLREHLGWLQTACAGHLSLFRVATQAHDAMLGSSASRAHVVATALADVLTQRRFETAPGIEPTSYETLVERFNASVRTCGTQGRR